MCPSAIFTRQTNNTMETPKSIPLGDAAARAKLISQNALFGELFKFFDNHPLECLTEFEGDVELVPEKLRVKFSRCKQKTIDKARLEAHDKFIDLQLVIKGSERIGIRRRADCARETENRLADGDVVFFGDAYSDFVALSAGEYVVLPPEWAHAPCIGSGEEIKCVAKILANG